MSLPLHSDAAVRCLFERVVDVLWPRHCAGCDLPGTLLCRTCESDLVRIDQRWACRRCGAPFGHLICTECSPDEPWQDETVSFGVFEGVIARAVVLMKDRDERGLASELARLVRLAVSVRWEGAPDVVSWVPASRRAIRRRGFDHAGDLAQSLCEQWGIAAPVPLLERRKAVVDQRRLGRSERAENVAGSFVVRATMAQGIRGRSILLVDDVLTTGATARAAVEALRGAGADSVRIATVARTW